MTIRCFIDIAVAIEGRDVLIDTINEIQLRVANGGEVAYVLPSVVDCDDKVPVRLHVGDNGHAGMKTLLRIVSDKI